MALQMSYPAGRTDASAKPRFSGVGLLVVAVFAATGGALLTARSAPPERVVQAERFVLKDKTGAERAVFGVSDDGSVGLHLTDTNGKVRVMLTVLEDYSARLELRDVNERNRVLLAFHEVTHVFTRDGKQVRERIPACGLDLLDAHGDPREELSRAQISLGADGSPFIKLRDRDGEEQWRAPARP